LFQDGKGRAKLVVGGNEWPLDRRWGDWGGKRCEEEGMKYQEYVFRPSRRANESDVEAYIEKLKQARVPVCADKS